LARRHNPLGDLHFHGLRGTPDRFVKIINKYVLKEHAGPFIFAVTALTSLMLLQYIARRFGDLVGKGLSWQVITEFFVLSIPFTVAMTMPMAVLVAVLYAFSRMGSENEITALRAGGVSTRRLLNTVLMAAMVIALGMVGFNDQLLPRTNHRLATLMGDIFRARPTFDLKEGVINPVSPHGQIFLRTSDIDRASGTMMDVVIDDLMDPNKRRTLISDSGTLELAANRRDLTVTLYDGVMISIPRDDPGQLSRLYYSKNRMKVVDVVGEFQQTSGLNKSKTDREMGVCEMQENYLAAHRTLDKKRYELLEAQWFERMTRLGQDSAGPSPTRPPYVAPRGIGHYYCQAITAGAAWVTRLRAKAGGVGVKTAMAATLPPRVPPQTPQSAQGAKAPPPLPPRAPIPPGAGVSRAMQESEAQTHVEVATSGYVSARRFQNRYLIEIHKKFALAAACIVLALVGGPIALRFPRGGVGLTLGVSFAIFAVYYVCLIGGESLANYAILQPWLSMWIANLLFLGIGGVLYLRMGHETATSRGGGGFGEWWHGVRAKFARRSSVATIRVTP
jgi:lipopolysaccharide export system permease protein